MILTTTVLVPLREVGRARSWRPVRGLLQNIHVVCGRVFCYPHAAYVYRVPDPHLTQQGIRDTGRVRSEEHTSELQSRPHLVCRLLLEKKKDNQCGASVLQTITVS